MTNTVYCDKLKNVGGVLMNDVVESLIYEVNNMQQIRKCEITTTRS